MIKRDDRIHPIISGNKWRKLSSLLSEQPENIKGIVSFGGGFSNHIHALSYVCNQLNMPFVAIIRGDYTKNPTPMLKDIERWGTTINYVDRKTYQLRNDHDFLAQLAKRYTDYVIVPEGGSDHDALNGVTQIVSELTLWDFDTIVTPVASGATLAGIVSSIAPHQHAIGVAVLKGADYLEQLVNNFLPEPRENWHISHNYHCGGYAKVTQALTALCKEVTLDYDIPIEGVYSGKLFFALKEWLQQQVFPEGHKIVVLHTGGIQGARAHTR